MKQYAREFLISRHYKEDKNIDLNLAIDCIHTGSKELEEKPNKFKSMKKYRKGELIVIYREYEEHFFIITAFWNKRGERI